jgi:hypothetical protein
VDCRSARGSRKLDTNEAGDRRQLLHGLSKEDKKKDLKEAVQNHVHDVVEQEGRDFRELWKDRKLNSP